MKYKKYEMGAYNLHVISTDKFKNVGIKINFKKLVEKKDMTYRNLLCKILFESTKKYPSRRDLALECENLYNSGCGMRNTLSGRYIVSSFSGELLNEKYTEVGYLEKTLAFFMEILFNPDIINNSFQEDKFNIVKKLVLEDIDANKDSPNTYANELMFEKLDSSLPLSYHLCGYKEDLEDITPESLYEYYKTLINSDNVDIFVCGNVEAENIKSLFSKLFKVNTIKKDKGSHYLVHKKFHKRIRSFSETRDLNQSILSIGAKINIDDDFERFYVAYIFNLIYGADSDSKLFKVVREENSLCYTIHSRYLMISSVLMINAGINKSDSKKAVNLIKKELKAMINGDFSEEDIEKAKTIFISGCEEALDSTMNIINTYITYTYFNSDTIDERVKKIKKVTKEDVISFAKKVYLDTIFLLEGDKDG